MSGAQWTLAALIAALALFVLYYRTTAAFGLNTTAALFVGAPALLAIAVTLAPRANSYIGMVLKAITIALLISGIFLGEGVICLLMMSPLFYLVGFAVGFAAEKMYRTGYEHGSRRLLLVLILPLLLSATEGIRPGWAFNRAETVVVTRIVRGAPQDISETLSRQPIFDRRLPFYLRLGFPRPIATRGAGLEVGDTREVRFLDKHDGRLTFEIIESAEGRVVFAPTGDSTHIGHWLTWRRSTVTWRPLDEETCEVEWTLEFERDLDPSWYFGPWQRYGVRLAGEYLIDCLATPDHTRSGP